MPLEKHFPIVFSFSADVICMIGTKKTILSLYEVDVQTKHAQNDKHFNSTKRDINKRSSAIHYWYNNTRSCGCILLVCILIFLHRILHFSQKYFRDIFVQALQTSSTTEVWRYLIKIIYFATSRLSRSASSHVHVKGPNEEGRVRGVGAVPRRRRSNGAMSHSTVAPPTLFEWKSPVLKPAIGRTPWNAVFLATPTSLFDNALQTRRCTKAFMF